MRSFWTKVDALEAWHAKLIDKPWMQPLKPTKFVIVLILLSTMIAAGMNWYVRHWQYQVWEQNPEIFYLDDGTPLFTTTDAPYFLGLAKAIKDEGNFQTFNEKRVYALTREKYEQSPAPNSLRDAPLLSVLLSLLSQDSSQKSLLEIGNNLIPFTAAVTALMIVFAFGAAGYWIPGAIAAAGGALSFSYLTRSGAGRIDTDQLNLGFFYLMIGLVIFAARSNKYTVAYALSLVAGLTYWMFDWWYTKPAFGWAFFIGLIWLSFVSSRDVKRVIFQSLLFFAASGLGFQNVGVVSENAYLIDSLNQDGLVFPNTFETITELKRVELTEILSRISGSVSLGVLSVVGLGLWGCRHPALAVVFAPAAAFALLNFLIGNRAIFYSAPMLWFGFAWLIITATKFLLEYVSRSKAVNILTMCTTVAGFAVVWFSSPTTYVQGPTFDKRIVKSFADISSQIKHEKAVVATWWDYGYMSMFMNQMPTFHDGGSQTSPATYFFANSLLNNSQHYAATRLQQLKRVGSDGIIRSILGQEQSNQVSAAEGSIYLVLTDDMANWISSISKIGNWDIFNAKKKIFSNVPAEYELSYEKLSCEPGDKTHTFICNGVILNTQTGQFGNNGVLDGMVVSRDGRQLDGQKYKNSTSAFMLHSEIGERGSSNMLIHRDLYFSVFHQLFHCGRVDKKYFELVYDDYPFARIFRVKG